MSNSDSSIIDSITFESQPDDISLSRVPNGVGAFTLQSPTFNDNNDITSISNEETSMISVYPNPFDDFIILDTDFNYSVIDIYGRLILDSVNKRKINTSKWSPGIYFIHLNNKMNQVVKIIKI